MKKIMKIIFLEQGVALIEDQDRKKTLRHWKISKKEFLAKRTGARRSHVLLFQ